MANVGGVNIGAGLNGQKKNYHHGNLAEAVLLRAAEIIDERGIEALSLRGIARDLGVSHSAPNRHFRSKASLLSALALDGWLKVRDATLSAAEETGSSNPHIRLNAMGRGYMRWALTNRALFRAINHPDVKRYAGDELNDITAENFAAKAIIDPKYAIEPTLERLMTGFHRWNLQAAYSESKSQQTRYTDASD